MAASFAPPAPALARARKRAPVCVETFTSAVAVPPPDLDALLHLFITQCDTPELHGRLNSGVETACARRSSLLVTELPTAAKLLLFCLNTAEKMFEKAAVHLLELLARPYVRSSASDELRLRSACAAVLDAVGTALAPGVPDRLQTAAALVCALGCTQPAHMYHSHMHVACSTCTQRMRRMPTDPRRHWSSWRQHTARYALLLPMIHSCACTRELPTSTLKLGYMPCSNGATHHVHSRIEVVGTAG